MKINTSYSESIKQIREKNLPSREHSRRIIHWEEKHRIKSEVVKALVFILPTRGCSWALSGSGGCSVCGYLYDNPQKPDFEMIMISIKDILNKKIQQEEEYSIKIFTSGSFLDRNEVPINVQEAILKELAKYHQIREIVLESRPEYINDKILQNIVNNIDISKIEIAIGLESANNKILKNSVNKGFFWEDFEQATERIIKFGAKVKAYLLFKPPFVTEYDSINDIFLSVSKIKKLGIDTVSINAISIHRGTYLSLLFEKNQYRPPWLWSLVYICKEIKAKFPEIRLICDVVAGGTRRGAHNCGECDKAILEQLKEFTLTQDLKALNHNIQCSCKEEWKGYVLHEKIS
ncbi:MAG: archaeosine biosynthesis radical SAM protein RaSEA [Candidatus Heimdallarchaeota archaeon]|nr:archaeosine biosynthesis radical SAM protein RaSEA [Candidatus Heimdallarchaeota archaeon]MCK4954187.1 archaeosine biosynthesis radical SAM protein RaSEA [Candidatus Heimdallarchaeota archaeon]